MANKQSYLGEFEYFILLSVLQLKGEAYGVTIRGQLKKIIDRDVSLGAIYSTIERLEQKGFIQSRKSEALPERGGKPKRLVKVTLLGSEELLATKDSFKETLIYKITQSVTVDQKNFKISNNLTKNSLENIKALNFNGVKRSNHIVAIGASTGGTEALKKLLLTMPDDSPPIVIAQHIPKSFSLSFAKRLDELCPMQVHEASHGQKIKQGNVYIAPGDLHLEVVHKNGALFCTLTDSAEVNRHKPAVDVLFDSLLEIAGNAQAVLLTGMGQDGAQGMLRLKQQGARTIVQDKNTSLIWGMPGKAHAIDAHCLELPLNKIGKSILDYAALNRDEMREAL